MQLICPHCHKENAPARVGPGEALECDHCRAWFVPDDQSEEGITVSSLHDSVCQELDGQPHLVKYEAAEEIAQGGMGRILRAFDPSIRREVAMKVVRDECDTEQRARLLEEAQITGQLEHPNIVPIHDMGLDATGNLFFIMKMVRGWSLEHVLDGIRESSQSLLDKYTMPRLLQMLEQVCNAVAFAHSQGVIHRDLKPGNIMLGDFGEVLVMDWGLAKLDRVRNRPTESEANAESTTAQGVAASGYREHSNTKKYQGDSHRPIRISSAVSALRQDSKLWGTRQGTIAGTPAYMSPEQARGELHLLDERSDIYSLGAILYEMLTLHPPVLASTESQIVQAVIDDEVTRPRLRAPSRRIPQELDAITMRALAKDPEERYQSVLDLQRDLRGFLDGLTIYRGEANFIETLFRLGRHYKWTSFIAGIVTSAVIGLGVYQHIHEITLREQAEAQIRERRQNEINMSLRARSYYQEAQKQSQDGRVDEAIYYLDRAIASDPKLLDARKLRAQLLEFQQRYQLALREIEEFLKIDPEDPEALRMADRYRSALRDLDTPSSP